MVRHRRAAQRCREALQKAGILYRLGGFEGNTIESYRANMALMHAMQCGHTSVEAAMRGILAVLGEQLSVDDRWHDALIKRLMKPMGGAECQTGAVA